MNNQLTSINNFNLDNIIYSKPSVNSIPNSSLQYRRVSISVKNPDNSIGDLLFMTSKLFSFGVQEDKFKPGTFKMTVCLYNKDEATAEEKEFVSLFEKVVEHSKDHLLSIKKDVKKPRLTRVELDKINDYSPIRYKLDEDGNISDAASPTIGLKLMQSTKNNVTKILTTFSDSDNGDELDPMTLVSKICHVNCIIKIDSIFIGSDKCYFQVKLYEAGITLLDKGLKCFLRNNNKRPREEDFNDVATYPPVTGEEDDDASFGSIQFE